MLLSGFDATGFRFPFNPSIEDGTRIAEMATSQRPIQSIAERIRKFVEYRTYADGTH